MTARNVGLLIKDAGVKFWNDNGPRLSAAITFYISLYLSPLLLTVVAIVGMAFGQKAAEGEIVEQTQGLFGKESATIIEQLIAQSNRTNHGVWAGLIVGVTLFIGATGLFSNLQSALNTIWNDPGKPAEGGIVSVIRERFLTFVLVCTTALLLLLSLVISTIVTGISGHLSGWFSENASWVETLNFAVSFVLSTALFAMMFKWLPETRLAWSDVWLGAAITAGLIALGRYPIGFYLHKVSVGSAFGAAETFVVFLIWVYYSTQLLLFGAELTFLYASRHGRSGRTTETLMGSEKVETQTARA